MNEFNTQELLKEGRFRLQFETDNRENFLAMQDLARRCVDNKSVTKFERIIRDRKLFNEFIKGCLLEYFITAELFDYGKYSLVYNFIELMLKRLDGKVDES